MNTGQLRVVGAVLFFVFIFLSGFRLSRSGKPYSVILLNVHKLISLAIVVFLVIAIYQINQTARLGATALAASVVTLVLFLGTMVSGGLLSTDKPMPTAIRTLHRITPYLTVLLTALTLYLVLSF